MTDPIVTLPSGQVRGVRNGDVSRFLGVPYAAAPVGDLRFAAPAEAPAWPGVRDATQPGPTAPQMVRDFPGLDIKPLIGDGWSSGDDYLTVNVWTPDQAGDAAAPGLPVMVFIHGGAFALGSGHASVQDGTAFARSGVVLMSINYRLGVDGFLPIDGAPTNLGLRDQIAALKWIKANAAAFGGDGGNITVFGESAGAMSIADLVASPLAQGLFQKAIIQSGHGSMVRTIAVTRRLTAKIAKAMGVRPDLAGFRTLSAQQCVDAVEKAQTPTFRVNLRDAGGREPAYGLSKFLPVYGDDVLPDHPLDALAKGVGSDIHVLIGANAEEMNLYFVPTGVREKVNGLLARLIVGRSIPRAGAILKAYGLGKRGSKAGEVMTRAMSDLVFRHPVRRFAAAHKGRTHLYDFAWRSPASGGQLGACHGIEMPFVFDTLATCTGPQGLAGEAPPQALADSVHKVWVDFAKTGELPWPEYDARARQVYALASGTVGADPDMPAAAFAG
jgi:para-nitrobenzyl esterase